VVAGRTTTRGRAGGGGGGMRATSVEGRGGSAEADRCGVRTGPLAMAAAHKGGWEVEEDYGYHSLALWAVSWVVGEL
jgi:hypothetical protein